MSTEINSVALVGGCGGFGSAFAGLFVDCGVKVTVIDQQAGADVVVDLRQADVVLADYVSNHDLVLLCLPEPLASLALASLTRKQPHGVGLVCDICSVKTNICAQAAADTASYGYVSIHPMFGPERGFAGQNLVFINVRDAVLVNAWRDLLSSWDVRIVDADALTHDKVTSMVQVLTHATLLSFAEAQSQLEVPDGLFEAMTTPIFRALDDTAQGMLRENPELYHNIQTSNPHGDDARQVFLQAVTLVVAALGEEKPDATADLFQRLVR